MIGDILKRAATLPAEQTKKVKSLLKTATARMAVHIVDFKEKLDISNLRKHDIN